MTIISAYASPERKAAWEKQTGLKAPTDPRQSAASVSLSSRTYSGATPPKSSAPTTSTGSTPIPKPPASPAAAAAANATPDPLQKGKENAQMFMQIIGGMPTDSKNRYLSAYTDFLNLPAATQTSYLAGLEQQAKDIVAPKIKQDSGRLQEDLDYALKQKQQEKIQLQATFDKLSTDIDFNRNHDIAKENKTAAQVMQNVGNVAFVTGVAGSGIFSRRTAYVREGLQDNVNNTNIQYNQQLGALGLKKGQGDATLDSSIQRLYDLNGRDITDLDQKQKQDELSLFLELAGNKFGKAGYDDANILGSGVGSKLPTGSAAADFAAGGSDADRKSVFAKQQQTKQAQALQTSITAARQSEDQQVSDYLNLRNTQTALTKLGRSSDASALQPALDQLSPIVSGVWARAAGGPNAATADEQTAGLTSRLFNGANLQDSGGQSFSDYLARHQQDFYQSTGLQYSGLNDSNRPLVTKYLQSQADLYKKYANSPT